MHKTNNSVLKFIHHVAVSIQDARMAQRRSRLQHLRRQNCHRKIRKHSAALPGKRLRRAEILNSKEGRHYLATHKSKTPPAIANPIKPQFVEPSELKRLEKSNPPESVALARSKVSEPAAGSPAPARIESA